MDNAMLLRRLSRMQKELYGEHKEFEEVDMKLEKLVEVDVYKAVDKAVAKAEKRGDERVKQERSYIKDLFMQGLSREEILKRLES